MRTRSNTDTICVSTKRQTVKGITLERCVHNAWTYIYIYIYICSLLVFAPIRTQVCTHVMRAFVNASHESTNGNMYCKNVPYVNAGSYCSFCLRAQTWHRNMEVNDMESYRQPMQGVQSEDWLVRRRPSRLHDVICGLETKH